MTQARFVHLRVHTAYSLSEGAIRIKELVQLCRRHGMPAVAITDTNNLFGGMEFSVTLAQAGVQPIIGCQLAINRSDGEAGRALSRGAFAPTTEWIVVLVQNALGYNRLLSLLDIAYRHVADGAEPHVSIDDLIAHGEGMILLTGGPSGPIGGLIADGRLEAAEMLLRRLAAAFPDRLYIELMRHGLASETAVEPALFDLAGRLGLPLVATNDVFFPAPEMFEAHDALLCIAEGTYLAESERRRVTPEHWFKGAAEMEAAFADVPEAVANTVLIAKRCAFMIEPRKPILPAFDGVAGSDETESLRHEARLGLDARMRQGALEYGIRAGKDRQHLEKAYRDRLEYELDVICKMGFAGYFLIVAEFIRWAKEQGIPVGPGRGSGAGSVVAWSLTITDLDPIRFGLLFERFLNPERVSMPDFDIDFCQNRRDEVIRHVQDRYGHDRVAQIITFGKLQARAVLRDVGRVMGMPYGQVDKICKLVPNNPAHPLTLAEAIEAEPQLKAMIESDETVARLVHTARTLEGLYRHASTHAAGVVIADRPLEQLIPVYRDPRSPLPVTGFNMKGVEAAGLVKFDFLGLKTLTVLAKAVELVEAGHGQHIDLAQLPLDDPRTFEMLARGETVGVFQLESAGMRNVLRRLKPDSFEDIIAVVALYRPGPMDNIQSYIRRKHGEEAPDYLYPTLEGILRETHGIVIYQEQVMQIAQELSGYSLGAADLLRRAMGKKIQAEMDQQRQTFVSGATARGVSESKASHIFDLVSKFAGYGFNKSHAASYALIAYQTAYMKANYPLEFFAASMTLDIGSPDKLNGFRQELARLGIRLLPPDINASGVTFAVEQAANGSGEGAIRYALAAIKNVGEGAMTAIVAEREAHGRFRDLQDFASRVDGTRLNKRQMESLVRAGAFDSLNSNRHQVFQAIELLLRQASKAVEERSSGQMGLFGGAGPSAVDVLKLPQTEDWPPMERLKEELDAIGFYFSAHPLDAYEWTLNRLKVMRWAEVVASGRSGTYVLAGVVVGKRERTSGKGNRYAFVQLSDTSGVFEITVFSEVLSAARDALDVGAAVLIKAMVQFDGDSLRSTAQSVETLQEAAARLAEAVVVVIDSAEPLPAMRQLLAERPRGKGQVRLVSWLENGQEVEIVLPGHYQLDAAMIADLRRLPGITDVRAG